jgi:hypothetical protein
MDAPACGWFHIESKKRSARNSGRGGILRWCGTRKFAALCLTQEINASVETEEFDGRVT